VCEFVLFLLGEGKFNCIFSTMIDRLIDWCLTRTFAVFHAAISWREQILYNNLGYSTM